MNFYNRLHTTSPASSGLDPLLGQTTLTREGRIDGSHLPLPLGQISLFILFLLRFTFAFTVSIALSALRRSTRSKESFC